MMAMKKKTASFNFDDVETLDPNSIEDNGFIEGDVSFGKTIATFDFGVQAAPKENKTFSFSDNNEVSKSPLKGLTPPIDGEQFTVKRSYQFRPSTIRKLNEIRAHHSDVNVYLNTILDEAILNYYDHIFPKKISS